jgi:hypothetical protein
MIGRNRLVQSNRLAGAIDSPAGLSRGGISHGLKNQSGNRVTVAGNAIRLKLEKPDMPQHLPPDSGSR